MFFISLASRLAFLWLFWLRFVESASDVGGLAFFVAEAAPPMNPAILRLFRVYFALAELFAEESAACGSLS